MSGTFFDSSSIHRCAFRLSVATGLRAFFNRRQHRQIARQVEPLLRLPETCRLVETSKGFAQIRYWHRNPGKRASRNTGTGWHWGFVTGRLVVPPIDARDYQLVCRTSHYGDAHFEAAFRYRPGECRIFAVKNVARDYCGWVGRNSLTNQLGFGSRREEAVELFEISRSFLAESFARVSLDPPSLCVQLAVRPELLSGSKTQALERMLDRYQQLHNDLKHPKKVAGTNGTWRMRKSLSRNEIDTKGPRLQSLGCLTIQEEQGGPFDVSVIGQSHSTSTT